jgi:hypothetical protein
MPSSWTERWTSSFCADTPEHRSNATRHILYPDGDWKAGPHRRVRGIGIISRFAGSPLIGSCHTDGRDWSR